LVAGGDPLRGPEVEASHGHHLVSLRQLSSADLELLAAELAARDEYFALEEMLLI
jgi:hypothetical protein